MQNSDLLSRIKERSKGLKRVIVFPDATDERAIQAARILTDQAIATPILIGNAGAITSQAAKTGTSLQGISLIEPATSDRLEEFAETFYDLRKAKGLQPAEARRQMEHPLFFGAMMVREGLADGSVAGSLSTTGDVLRAGIQVIGLAENITIVSSFFLMIFSIRCSGSFNRIFSE